MPPKVQRTLSVKEKKLNDRRAKLAQDEQRSDGNSIKDTDLTPWIAPPVSWGYQNLIDISVRRFKEFIEIMGPNEPRGKPCPLNPLRHPLIDSVRFCLTTISSSSLTCFVLESSQDQGPRSILWSRCPACLPRAHKAVYTISRSNLFRKASRKDHHENGARLHLPHNFSCLPIHWKETTRCGRTHTGLRVYQDS